MRIADAYQAEAAKMRQRIEYLEAEVCYWKGKAQPPKIVCPLNWRLTESEDKVLAALYAAPANTFSSRENLHAAMYGDRGDPEETSTRVLDVFICKLRPKLAPHGIVIENVWGRGYRLTDESRSIIAAVQRTMQ